jgi:hypothetical protein
VGRKGRKEAHERRLMRTSLFRRQTDGQTWLLDDPHQTGNIKGGRGKRSTSISSRLKSYQKIVGQKRHEGNEV